MKKAFITIGVSFVIVLVLNFCLASGVSAGSAKEWKIAQVSPMSGPAAPWGIMTDRGAKMAAEKINAAGGVRVGDQDYKIKILSYDNKYSPTETVSAINKVIFSDKVKYVIVLGTVNCMAIQKMTEKNKVLLAALAGGVRNLTNPENPLTFRFMNSDNLGPILFYPEFIKQFGVKRIGFIVPNDETGYSGLREAKKVIKKMNLPLRIVAEEYFQRGVSDFTPTILRILPRKPDLIDFSTASGGDIGLIIKQLRMNGYTGLTAQTVSTADPSSIWNIAGKYAVGHFIMREFGHEPPTPLYAELSKWYEEKYGEKATTLVIEAYNIIIGMKAAVEKAGTLDNTIKVANTWARMQWESPLGKVRFGGTEQIVGIGINRNIIFKFPMSRVLEGGVAKLWMKKALPSE